VKRFLSVLIFLLCSFCVFGAEYVDGRIKLVIHENTGRFSVYFMTDIAREKYDSFFVDQDPRTSFLALMINDRNYRMGETSTFRTKIGGSPSNPALIFESNFLTVTEEFSFVRTAGSSLVNGVRITISIQNRSERSLQAGARLLLDTSLGEKEAAPFTTDRRQISAESVIDETSGDLYWISRGGQLGVMGSVSGPNLTTPDSVHFANWKRLNDAPWRAAYVGGRNFNYLPYSIGDSAVCYYYEPKAVESGGTRTISLVLSSEDENGFNLTSNIPDDISRMVQESTRTDTPPDLDQLKDMMNMDLITVRDLIAKIDEYISSGASINDEELAALELVITRLKAKYNQP
jgi:hypothetical protein